MKPVGRAWLVPACFRSTARSGTNGGSRARHNAWEGGGPTVAEGEDPKRPISLFYSYSHKDEDLRDRLFDHLAVLRWNGRISDWHDRKIPPGAEWEDAIDRYLTLSDIVLLLVSASFIASPYCHRKEMMTALERHDGGEATVIPVILRHCRWKSTSLGKLQALPKDGKPVTAWADQDEAFDDVVAGIERVVEELRAARATAEVATVGKTPEPTTPRPSGIVLPRLTERERECLNWSAKGKAAWAISMILGVSENTVNAHLKNAIKKLGASTRTEAVAIAVRAGFIDPN